MKNKLRSFIHILAFISLGLAGFVQAGTIRVAVASNFAQVMPEIIKRFEGQTQHRVKVSYGSSGKLYAQIRHGAPFDLFFSADQDKPTRLINEGLAREGSQFTYAQGRLALYRLNAIELTPKQQLLTRSFNKLAIANSKLAPYGLAANQVLKTLNLNQRLDGNLVVGENINQTYQFVATGNAEIGFVALSQLINAPSTNIWVIPQTDYQPIKQDAVTISATRNLSIAVEFMQYLQTPEIKSMIETHGYLTP